MGLTANYEIIMTGAKPKMEPKLRITRKETNKCSSHVVITEGTKSIGA